MKNFEAHEFVMGAATGTVEVYQASDIDEAVKSVLYTRRLTNKTAYVGPSKRVVYSGVSMWSVVSEIGNRAEK